jgi:hypothetical protein
VIRQEREQIEVITEVLKDAGITDYVVKTGGKHAYHVEVRGHKLVITSSTRCGGEQGYRRYARQKAQRLVRLLEQAA